MSTQKNTDPYEAGLIAAMHALDALCSEKTNAVLAFDPEAEGYHFSRHVAASYERTGALDALAVVTGMLDNYRKAIA